MSHNKMIHCESLEKLDIFFFFFYHKYTKKEFNEELNDIVTHK